MKEGLEREKEVRRGRRGTGVRTKERKTDRKKEGEERERCAGERERESGWGMLGGTGRKSGSFRPVLLERS